MSCAGCAAPNTGLGIIGCRQCLLRDIARSPEFYASKKACKLTPAYAARLMSLGADIVAANEEVKAVAETIHAMGPKT